MAKPSALWMKLPIKIDPKKREQILRRYSIKPSSISRTWEADGFALYLLKRGVAPNLASQYLADERLIRRIRRIHEYIEEYKELIELERNAERKSRLEEIRRFSAKELERFGRAILGLIGRRIGRLFDLHIVRYGREQRIESEIASGDIVLISRGDPLKSDLSATVMGLGRNFIEVAFNQAPPKWALSHNIRIDLFVNDVSFKRMEKNLEAMRHLEEPYRRIRDIVLELEPCGLAIAQETKRIEGLNPSQLDALGRALGAKDIFLIHGPPGTGKTTTLVEIILAHLSKGSKVLASADSNVAVDNTLEKLAQKGGVRLVRVGHPARIDSALERFSLIYQLMHSPQYQEILQLQRQAESLAKQRAQHSKPTPSRLRGMSRERVLKLAKEGRSARGVSAQTIGSMARWIEEDRKVEEAFERLRALERAVMRRILGEADVVLASNSMLGSETLEEMRFDLAVIDEGSQQIEPSTLLPLLRAKKAVLAGDHRQLPPTVLSNQEILKRSLFERLMLRNLVPSLMLNIQYRMNKCIMDFPNRLMYKGALRADASIANRRPPYKKAPKDLALDPNYAVVFADSSALEAYEHLPHHSNSYENPLEAAYILEWVKELIECGIAASDIGIITPYLAQVKLLRRLLEEFEQLEIKSVDGFQGREKEIIIISFVRSNLARSIGFLTDRRRLNVAMTRARSKLIMIGDRSTLEPNDPFTELFSWLEARECAKIVKLSS